MPLTIKEIAQKLGVSKSTVSRALRDSSEIGEETKKRVLKLANELDYTPNPLALSLLKARTQDLGVIVPDISNPFFALVIAGIEDVAIAGGYHVVIYQSHDDFERELMSAKHVFNRRKDGLLVSLATSTKDFTHFKQMHEKGFPMVFFDRLCPEIDTHKVSVDDFEGAYIATEHLIQQGCTRIATIMGPQNMLISKQRFYGFQAAMAHYKMPIHEPWVLHSEFQSKASYALAQKLFEQKEKPDGVFAASDSIGLGCHAAISHMGLSMPDDVALIGFSDHPWSELLNPPMSSVSAPAFEMGQKAARLLIDMIKNPETHSSGFHNVLKTRLVVRKSSLRKPISSENSF